MIILLSAMWAVGFALNLAGMTVFMGGLAGRCRRVPSENVLFATGFGLWVVRDAWQHSAGRVIADCLVVAFNVLLPVLPPRKRRARGDAS